MSCCIVIELSLLSKKMKKKKMKFSKINFQENNTLNIVIFTK